MRILIDTNVLLWLRFGSRRVGETTLALLKDPENDVFVSIATAWEIAIKASLDKLKLPSPISLWFERAVAESGLIVKPIELRHVYAVAKLAHHHRDPFDRLLLAQAQVEGLSFVTSDHALAAYEIAIVDAEA